MQRCFGAPRLAHNRRARGPAFSVVRSHGDVLGVLLLFDPDGRAGTLDNFTLDYGATALALELSHRRALAQAELRRRRDLIEDLFDRYRQRSAYLAGRGPGNITYGLPTVLVLRWENTDSDLVDKAAAHWANRTGRDCRSLAGTRPRSWSAPESWTTRPPSRHLGRRGLQPRLDRDRLPG